MGQSMGNFRKMSNSEVGVDPISKWRSVICLLVLFGVYVLNQANRQVLPVLIPAGVRCYYNGTNECDLHTNPTLVTPNKEMVFPYKAEIQNDGICDPEDCIEFTNAQQGVLTGPAVTIVYTVVGIPISRFADTRSRVIPLVFGLAVWIGMVCLTAFAETYWMLLLAQLIIGIGEATCNPAAFALIADYFKTTNRAKALSLYYFAVYLGGSLGYALGAVNVVLCWRWTFLIIAIAGGVMLFLVIAVLREPHSDETGVPYKSDSYYTVKETIQELVSCKPYVILCVAASIRNISGYALGAWLATFYAKHFDQSSQEYGLRIALIVLTGGGLSCVIGGFCADRFSVDRRAAKALIISISQFLAAPCIIATLLVPTTQVSYGLLFVAYLTAETWLGPAAAIIQDLFSPNLRAQASAVYIALMTLLGGGLGPILVPGILELKPEWGECDKGVGYALAIIVPTCYFIAAVLFLIVGYLMKDVPVVLSDETIYLTYDTSEREGDTASEKSWYGSRRVSEDHTTDGHISEAL
ncbi:MFS-type efflux pump MSMEG_3705-like [Amphiura filiformis]|uniref:MFS-type efflux pump MSMEG_3705-like n=1 Tax=Amphiura filiformis TaxID=82378 RepID=UPI003B219558